MDDIKAEAEPVRIRKRHSRRSHPKRKTSFWLLLILLITSILSAFTMNIPSLIDKYLNFMDTTYRPMDTDRVQYEKEEQASPATKKDDLRNR
jgi:ABC-type microcin C transport system permease subunit YejE